MAGKRGLIEQLEAIEQSGGKGTLQIARGKTLDVSSLDRVYFPAQQYTKGDLMRYYALIAPVILPTIAGRPLVLKRSPGGVEGETFFQQKPPAQLPAAVRAESVAGSPGEKKKGTEKGKGKENGAEKGKEKEREEGKLERRIVGGDIATLLYTVQLGCISVDPWLSRMGSIEAADYSVIDLDPGPEASFGRVVEAARLVHDEMERLGIRGVLKSSGSRGLHIYLPLPTATPYDTAAELARAVVARVAGAHPEETTIQRSLGDRPPTAVYLDHLQNARGKSVAGAYCVRAKPGATVSTPLDWSELREALDPHSFTIQTIPARLERQGDLWSAAMRRRNSRRAVESAISTD